LAHSRRRRPQRRHAGLQVHCQPVSYRLPEPVHGCQAVGVSHRLPRFFCAHPRAARSRRQLGRLHFRQPDAGSSPGARASHRRDQLPDALFQRRLFDQLQALGNLRPGRARDFPAASARPQPVVSTAMVADIVASRRMTGRFWFVLLWLAVVVAAAWLRLWQIDLQILLDDEWHALHRLMHASYGEIFLSFGHADYCIPLTLMFKALAETVGLHAWQMRALPMLSGLAAVVLLPWLLRTWLRPGERLCLGALIAISPLLVHFSRYARPYALVVLLGFAAIILLWHWWHHGGRGRAAGFLACAVAAAWLHPLTTLYTG